MKLTSQGSAALKSNNVSPDRYDMGIGDSAKIIHILRDSLYSHPVQTAVQEYLSNGRDAMREAGRGNEAIRVTLPTKADMQIVIRDYGKSTKTDDDSQTGGFGLGAKSAWAYTDSFGVTTYLDGESRSYICHTGHTFSGSMELIAKTPTKEKNGTEIRIALKSDKDIPAFIHAVYRATLFWQTHPIIKGISEAELPAWYKTPKHSVSGEGWAVFDSEALNHMFPSKGGQLSGLLAVVDGIPYVVSPELMEPELKDLSAILRDKSVMVMSFKTGQVAINANRETLSDKPSSRQALSRTAASIKAGVVAKVNEMAASKNDVPSFVGLYRFLSKTLRIDAVVNPLALKLPGRRYELEAQRGSVMLRAVFDSGFHLVFEKFFFKQRGRRWQANPVYNFKKLCKDEEIASLPINTDEKAAGLPLLLVLDTSEVERLQRNRLRSFLTYVGMQYSTFLLSSGGIGASEADVGRTELNQAMADLEAVALSSIPLKPVDRKLRDKEETAGKLCLHLMNMVSTYGNYHPKLEKKSTHLLPGQIQGKTFYFVLQVDGKLDTTYLNEDQLTASVAYLRANGHEVCALAPKTLQQAQKLGTFLPIESFWKKAAKETVFTADEIAFLSHSHAPELPCWFEAFVASGLTKQIADDNFTSVIFSAVERRSRLPKSMSKYTRRSFHVHSSLLAASPLAKILKEKADQELKAFKSLEQKYPLLDKLVGRDVFDEHRETALRNSARRKKFLHNMNEVICYVNGKHAATLADKGKKASDNATSTDSTDSSASTDSLSADQEKSA